MSCWNLTIVEVFEKKVIWHFVDFYHILAVWFMSEASITKDCPSFGLIPKLILPFSVVVFVCCTCFSVHFLLNCIC